MTTEQMEQFDALKTVEDRARFLLEIGVTAKIDIVNLEPVYRACVGSVNLPVTASTDALAIKKGTEWLREKGGVNVH